MKQLTICTHRYSQPLETYAIKAVKSGVLTVKRAGWQSRQFSINCQYVCSALLAEGLMALITDIAQRENPIYQHSPKLRDMADDLHQTPFYTAILHDLVCFLKHSRILHLEGYVVFRMAKYREKLDMISYSLIKKMKLIQQD